MRLSDITREELGFKKGKMNALNLILSQCHEHEKLFRSPDSKVEFILLIKEILQ